MPRRVRGCCGRKIGLARTLSPPARVTADSRRHPFRGTKRRLSVAQRERVDGTRAGSIAAADFRLRLAVGLAYASATRHAAAP